MKKIVNGRKYDTATAKLIKEWSSCDRYGCPYSSTDNRYDVVTMYKKRNGEYFLYRKCAFGEEITPIDNDDAIKLTDFEFIHDSEFDRSLAVDISDEFGYFGEWD